MNLARMTKRRSFVILLVLTAVWGGLLFRLFWIQLAASHHFSAHDVDLVKSAVRQRQQLLILDSGRGDILDRNGHPLTGHKQQALAVFPLARGSLDGPLASAVKQAAQIVERPVKELDQLIRDSKQPTLLRGPDNKLVDLDPAQAEKINRLHIPGLLAVTVVERYFPNGVAKHAIGYVSQNPKLVQTLYAQEWRAGKMSLESVVGASGLERSFDRFLQGVGPSGLSYIVDGEGHPLRGLELRYQEDTNSFYPLTLVTTLDGPIQQQMERVADRAGITQGAIVVLDAASGDVLAMVSRPDYDQTRVQAEAGAWQNHALKQLPPGSVFKTVVAAAALAEGAVSPTETFLCEGEYGKYGFSCWKKGGHGRVTLEEAFAQSCNIAFAQIARRLGGDTIEAYAKRLGLTTPNGWSTPSLYGVENVRQLDGEEVGRVFAKGGSRDEGALIQTAIGQRDVRITPLAAANLMVTILHGGKPQQVRLVQDILYRNGSTFFHFAPQPLAADGVDKLTARRLTGLLRKVVEEGTGEALQRCAWPVAGKSGTAQTTVFGAERETQWFVGYAPADEPRYAIAVVAENQPVNASHKATKAFGLAVDALSSRSAQSAQSPATHR